MQQRHQRRTTTEDLVPALAISFDEMWTYLNARKPPKRQEEWIWTAMIHWKDGTRTIEFEVGDRSEATFHRLLDRLPVAQTYHSDHYEVYNWLPRDRHHRGKGGMTNRNEGVHSILRDKLARLKRATKAYSKSLEMLRDSIALVCLNQAWI